MNRKTGVTTDGREIIAYQIKNNNGMTAEILNFGANLHKLILPDGCDVVLGYEDIKDYFNNSPYYGCTVARNANRIGGAAFDLGGVHYEIEKNDNGHNNLHSGSETLAKKIWEVENEEENSITFFYDSPDMEMGFPGNCHITVTYTLTDDNALILDYTGKSDKDTIFNPTNHSYFNLNGLDGSTILEHKLMVDADSYTYADSESIPDGVIRDVAGTPMDFTEAKLIGDRINDDYDMLNFSGGYDHNWCLNQDTIEDEFSTNGMDVFFAGYLESPASGRRMDFYTSLPGIQVYTGNFIDPGEIMKGKINFVKNGGVALETQFFPNAINIPSFEQPVIAANEIAKSRTVYRFS